MYQYEFPRPALTVDVAAFSIDENRLQILLIKRGKAPFAGKWALPGGFVDMDEAIEVAALRELEEETSLSNITLEQLGAFGDVNRDPRERVVSVAYLALINRRKHRVQSGSDARDAKWWNINELPKQLAFDHSKILKFAISRLKQKVRHQPLGLEMLPKKFSLAEIQTFYEIMLERKLDKRKFRRKLLATELLVALDENGKAPNGRTTKLFRFDRKKYRQMSSDGFYLDV